MPASQRQARRENSLAKLREERRRASRGSRHSGPKHVIGSPLAWNLCRGEGVYTQGLTAVLVPVFAVDGKTPLMS